MSTALDEFQTVKKSKGPAPPKYRGLEIPACNGGLSKNNAKSVADFHRKCRKFDDDLAELFDKHAELMSKAPDMTLRKIREVGEELKEKKTKSHWSIG